MSRTRASKNTATATLFGGPAVAVSPTHTPASRPDRPEPATRTESRSWEELSLEEQSRDLVESLRAAKASSGMRRDLRAVATLVDQALVSVTECDHSRDLISRLHGLAEVARRLSDAGSLRDQTRPPPGRFHFTDADYAAAEARSRHASEPDPRAEYLAHCEVMRRTARGDAGGTGGLL